MESEERLFDHRVIEDYGTRNTVFTRSRMEAALNLLKSNPITSDQLTDAQRHAVLILGLYHYEAGLQNLGAWAAAMQRDVGKYPSGSFWVAREKFDAMQKIISDVDNATPPLFPAISWRTRAWLALRRGPSLVLTVIILGATVAGFLLLLNQWRNSSRMSAEFRQKATPAYVWLEHMQDLPCPVDSCVEDAAFLSAQFEVKKSLAEASPLIRTSSDRDAYRFLQRWLEGYVGWMWDEHSLASLPPRASSDLAERRARAEAWHQNMSDRCWWATSSYFEPPDENLNTTPLTKANSWPISDPKTGKVTPVLNSVLEEERDKRECLMNEAEYRGEYALPFQQEK